MYKFNFRLVTKQFIILYTKIEDIHFYHTRQRSSIEYAIPRTRLKAAQKSFAYTGIGNMVIHRSKNSFKTKLLPICY